MIWAGVYKGAAGSIGAAGTGGIGPGLRASHEIWSERSAWLARRCLEVLPRGASGHLAGQGAALTELSTGALVERAQAGDPDAYAQLFRAYETDVGRVCGRMLGSVDAKDAKSEVFLRVRRSLHTYDSERPFRPWLLTIAGNYCIDELRHRAAERRVFVELESDAGELRESGPSPLSRLIASETRDAVSLAIENLPVKYRLPLLLRYFSDYDYAAIADALGVTRNQVGSLLFRAKRMLREQLAPPVAVEPLEKRRSR